MGPFNYALTTVCSQQGTTTTAEPTWTAQALGARTYIYDALCMICPV